MLVGSAMEVAGIQRALEGDADLEFVASAHGLERALDAVGTMRPDVLVTWLDAEGSGGLKLLERLTRDGEVQPPATVLIGRDEPIRQYVEAILLGVRALLTERVGADTLQRAVRTVAAGHAYVGPSTTSALFEYLRGASELLEAPAEPTAHPTGLDRLTPREESILTSLAEGASNETIARQLRVSTATVKSSLSRLLGKLGVESRLQAGLIGYQWREHLKVRSPDRK